MGAGPGLGQQAAAGWRDRELLFAGEAGELLRAIRQGVMLWWIRVRIRILIRGLRLPVIVVVTR